MNTSSPRNQNESGLGKVLRIPVAGLPTELDYLSVPSFFDYVLLQSLGRGLVTRNSLGEIIGDLAERWTSSGDFKEFAFKIRPDQQFSNGSPIRAEDVIYIFSRIIKNGKPLIHFAKPENILSAVKSGEATVVIKLSQPEPDFIMKVMHPEFSIVPQGYEGIGPIEKRFSVTSGAYFVTKRDQERVVLSRNQFFPNVQSGPSSIEVIAYQNEVGLKKLINEGKVNYYLPTSKISSKDHVDLEKSGWVARSTLLGFSHFIALNPNSNALKSRTSRLFILDLLSDLSIDWRPYQPFIRPAKQIYLEAGPGRLSKQEVNQLSQQRNLEKVPLTRGAKLSFLVHDRFEFRDAVVSKLAGAGLSVDITEYSSFQQYAELLSKSKFDLVHTNNDFSSLDLMENIAVTFNQDRPLIFLDTDSLIHDLIARASKIATGAERYELIHQIGIEILRQGYAVPVYHILTNDYAPREVDRSALSTVEPEFRLWKIKMPQSN